MFLAVYATLIGAPLLKIMAFRTALKAIFYFTAGTGPIIILLFWRNEVLCGDVQPYDVTGQWVPLITSVRVLL